VPIEVILLLFGALQYPLHRLGFAENVGGFASGKPGSSEHGDFG
jgi:hypothetical protein